MPYLPGLVRDRGITLIASQAVRRAGFRILLQNRGKNPQPGSKQRECPSEGSPVTVCKPGFARGAQSAPQDARLAPAGADPPACACACVTCLATCVLRAARKAAEEAARKAASEEEERKAADEEAARNAEEEARKVEAEAAARKAAEEAARKAATEEAADLRRRLEVARVDAQKYPPAHGSFCYTNQLH